MSDYYESPDGRIKLYRADCLDVLPTLTGVDAVVTDPPYGISHKRGSCADRGKGITLGASGIIGDNEPFDPSPWLAFPNVILWGANWFSNKLPPGRWLIWDKQEYGGSGDFSEAEIAWHNKGSAVRFFRHMWLGVQRSSQVGEARLHPTEKPVMLMLWCLEQTKVKAGETVLDPFMGSGTTGVSCLRTGRSFIGIEKDPKHFQTALERIKRELAQPDMFLAPPPKRKEQPDMFLPVY